MKLQIICCIIGFIFYGTALIWWNAVDVRTEKKKVSEGHYMVKGFAIGYVLCALTLFVAFAAK